MTVDDLLTGIAAGFPDILTTITKRLKTPPCRFGSLLEALHELDLSINHEPPGLHRQAQIARHQTAEIALRALVKEGSLGCKICPCCARFTSSGHVCELTEATQYPQSFEEDYE